METEIIIGIYGLVYLVSCYIFWKYLQLAHSKGGRWEVVKIDEQDIFTMVFPVINTVACIVGWVTFPPRKKKLKEKTSFDKFFNIKK